MKTYREFLTEGKNVAKNIGDMKWKTSKGIAQGRAKTAYGVLNDKGEALSSDGVSPAIYHSMKIAKEMALYADGFKDHSWVRIEKNPEDFK